MDTITKALDVIIAWIAANPTMVALVGGLIWSEIESMTKNTKVNGIIQRVWSIISVLKKGHS